MPDILPPDVPEDRVHVPTTADGRYICPDCNNDYAGIVQHWAKSSDCSMPRFSDTQQDLLTGLFLVGGSISAPDDKTPYANFESGNHDLLAALREYFGVLSRDLAEIEKSDTEGLEALNPAAADRDFDTSWRFTTRSHEQLFKWHDAWYDDDGDRRVPADLTPTPTSLRAAYALNGHIISEHREYVRIPMTRTMPSDDTITRLFGEFGVDINRGVANDYPYLHVRLYNVEAFFDYIGWEPMPGCAEKWPASPADIDEPAHECPVCLKRFSKLGNHWTKTGHDAPTIGGELADVVKGALIAKAIVRQSGSEDAAMLEIRSPERNALDWVNEKLGWLTAGISEIADADTATDRLNAAFGTDATARARYVIHTWSHPGLRQYYAPTDGVARSLPDEMFGEPLSATGLAVPVLLQGRLITRSNGEIDRIVVNANRTAVEVDALTRLYQQFDAHTETSSRPITVIKDVAGFLDATGLTREDLHQEGE